MSIAGVMRTGMQTRTEQRLVPELVAMIAVLAISFAIHCWLPIWHPTPLISDFLGIVTFASDMAEKGPFAPGWYWTLFSAGTPTLLSVPLALSGADDALVARLATAAVVSLLPVVPLVVLRGVLPLWSRLLVAGILMLLPSHIVFSGVVAQDNWVQLPSLALACLAVRNAYGEGRGYPVWSAILWCLALYVRQEMLVVLLPLAVLAAWPISSNRGLRSFVAFAGIALALMLGVAGQRQAATGDFSLASRHGGVSMLGSYIPGAGFSWIPYDDYIKRHAPELVGDAEGIRKQAGRLALEEVRQRPFFHLVRRMGAVADTLTARDGSLQYWAFGADAGAGPGRSANEAAFAAHLAAVFARPVLYSTILLHALFLGAAYIGLRTRDRALIAITLVVLLKVGIHFVVAVQARFFLMVFVLEALAIGLAAVRLYQGRPMLRSAGLVVLAGLVLLAVVVAGLGRLNAWVVNQDRLWEQAAAHDYRARLAQGSADCQLSGGRILSSGPSGITFAVEHPDPEPGEFAELRCLLSPVGKGGDMVLEVEDGYAPGGFPDRMIQFVEVEGEIVRRHDVANRAWSGWWQQRIPVVAGSSRDVRVRVEGLRPDKGPAWGDAARTSVRFSEAK
jgi:hypothetical protein